MPKGFISHLYLLPFAGLLMVLPYPGTVALRLLLLVIAFVISLGYFRDPNVRRGFPPCRFGLGLWVLLCVGSLGYTIDPAYTLKELQNEILYAMLAFSAFYSTASRPDSAAWLMRALAVGLMLIGLLAIGSRFHGGGWNEAGLQGGVGSFSTYISLCIPALVWLIFEDPSSLIRRIAPWVLAFALVLAALTLQRALWPTLALELGLGFHLLVRRGRLAMSQRRAWLWTIVILIVMLGGLLAANKLRGEMMSKIVPPPGVFNVPIAEQNGQYGDPRLSYWAGVVATIGDHPWTGIGFGLGLMKRAYPELIPPNLPDLWHSHNIFLNYAIQLGIPGALALLGLFLAFGREYWRASNESAVQVTGIAGLMLLAAVLTRNQTNDFFRRDLALFFWCQMGIFSALVKRRSNVS